MSHIKRRGKAGAAKNYITRNQALRKLQLSLKDFRKLCIWKGIFPREPRSRKRAHKSASRSTTFYYAKDIQYLLHEPLIQKFRDLKTLEKKISRALGRREVDEAKRLEAKASRPSKTGRAHFTLDHIIRERYPTFHDALRDLDDCLSMLFLFANLPSTVSVPPKVIARCERLCLEFQQYLIASNSLQKSFLSIKGIYYQATIQGEDILWLVPYKFNQRIVGDIDFRIMGTFVEFYLTLLSFVNYRLYTSLGLRYPPKFDAAKDDKAAELAAFTLEGNAKATETLALETSEKQQHGDEADNNNTADVDPDVQKAVNKVVRSLRSADGGENESEEKDSTEEATTTIIDKFEPAVEGGDVLLQPSVSSGSSHKLFSKMTVYLSRETPRQPLEFLLRAFGCKRIGWDAILGEGAFTTNEADPSITHQIVDRPPIVVDAENQAPTPTTTTEDGQTAQKLFPYGRVPGRVYVQPQWVWDCVNEETLQSPEQYAPGAQLPPHLSPFVRRSEGQYDPSLPLEQQQTEAEALHDDTDDDDDDDEATLEDGMQVDDGESEEEDGDKADDSEGDDHDDEDEDEDDQVQHQLEIEAELQGQTVPGGSRSSSSSNSKEEARKQLARKAREEADEIERAKGMLSKKKRRLFEAMQRSNARKSEVDEKLRAKRRRLEKEKAKAKK